MLEFDSVKMGDKLKCIGIDYENEGCYKNDICVVVSVDEFYIEVQKVNSLIRTHGIHTTSGKFSIKNWERVIVNKKRIVL